MHKKQGKISRFKPSHLSLEKIGYVPIASVRLLPPEGWAGTREIVTAKVGIARKAVYWHLSTKIVLRGE